MDWASLSDEELIRHATTLDVKERPAFLLFTIASRERIASRRQFVEKYIKIRDKQAEIIPLIPNYAQRKLEAKILRARRRGMPPRIIVLKARQTGFCVSPNTRVLTADLRWVKIKHLEVGDEVVAVEEESSGVNAIGRRKERCMRTARIKRKCTIRSAGYRIKMSNGTTLECTPGHRWMCRQRGGSYVQWRKTRDVRVGDSIRFVTSPWGEPEYEDGWMGGMLDGEGWLRNEKASLSLGVCQREGNVLDRLRSYMESSGCAYREALDDRRSGDASKLGDEPIGSLHVGRMTDIFRMIGLCRPSRWIGGRWWEGRALPGKRTGMGYHQVVDIEEIPDQEMVDLETSEGTYLAEGFVSHNSTYTQAVLFEDVLRRKNVRAKVMADDEDTGMKMLMIFRRFIQNLPRAMRPKPKSDRDTRIMLPEPWNSSIDIGSSKGKPIHGDTIQNLHATEVSRWKDPEEHMKGLLQNVPKDPKTLVVMESTAFGAQGYFHDKFWAAYRGDGVYDWMFVPWFEHEEYRVPCPPGMEEEIKGSLTSDEEWLTRQVAPQPFVTEAGRRAYKMEPITFDQLLWRRFTLSGECSNDKNAMMEQYPANPDEAFISTGSPYFNPEKLRELKEDVEEPLWRGRVDDLDYVAEDAFGQNDVVLNQLDPNRMRNVEDAQQQFEAALFKANLAGPKATIEDQDFTGLQ